MPNELDAARSGQQRGPDDAARSGQQRGPDDAARIRLWLSRRRLLEAVFAVSAAGGLFLIGAAVFLASYVVLFALVFLAFGGSEWFSEGVSLALVALLYAALWIGNRRESREKSQAGTCRRVCAAVLFAGPRSISAALRLLALALRLLRMDVPLCARALAAVLARADTVPVEDPARAKAGRVTATALAQLADVWGVVLHDGDPPAVSLSPRLREEITSTFRARRTR